VCEGKTKPEFLSESRVEITLNVLKYGKDKVFKGKQVETRSEML
jgi:hypothetical protein